jgi:DNA-binding winged helix-turn-helix (wHTH) protein/tetratricopeptide (TPR) repeat protein
MSHDFSNENQSPIESAYRFGAFELSPRDRLFKCEGVAIPLQPKAFDALLCLVRRVHHLVSKQELTSTLWPQVHVSEANLTNIIVSLRKIVGRDAIRTVSKYGYSFEMPVTGEPGIARPTYERFVRARELAAQRSLESMQLARDLYWTCIAEDPGFAPAWAWLGRCCWFLGKFSTASLGNVELARTALQRAFAIDQDLASAHHFYTFVQVDTGHAGEALQRLFARLARHPGEPESLTGLVQVLRFCGLLPESIEAHKQAAKMDPAVVTSVAHSLFLAGDYAGAIESYGGRAAYYLDAAAWAALGDHKRAKTLLRDRLNAAPLSRLMTALLSSLLAVLEDRNEDAVRLMESSDTTCDPEIQLYFARHYAKMGCVDAAVNAVKAAAQSGFTCAPETLQLDVWLVALRDHPEFGALLHDAEARVQQARTHFESHAALERL